VGSEIKLYKGKEDNNERIVLATPTFQKPNYALTWERLDGYGSDGYRDGYDGYDFIYNGGPGLANRLTDGYDGYFKFKTKTNDNLTTNGAAGDAAGNFNRLDYCGTWRALSPASFMQGQCSHSYFGGTQVRNGQRVRGSNVYDQMLQREELLLETTGEPFVLLRRMWTGTRCLCYMNRREHSDSRCPICFGTTFVSGYLQFFNKRRGDRRILLRIDATKDDLKRIDNGLEQDTSPTAWTLPYPTIKDSDVLVRFNVDGTEDCRLECLDVTRNRVLFGQTGVQKLTLRRILKTEIIYSFPIVRNTSPVPGSLTTSIDFGPGLKPHSHEVIFNASNELEKLNVATLEAENHNHIIYNGIVYEVLGHKHTLT
jgi:hypothetical protein